MTIYFDKLNSDLTTASVPCGTVNLARRTGFYRNYIKRGLDIALVVATAPFVLPVVATLALCVARDGSSPFYGGKRVGKGGVEFPMLKLRTMVPNADNLLDSHLANDADARTEWQATQKLKDDPRITKLGRLLRKVSFDELPQLWNVLRGDMSLVGPRPILPEQRSIYPGLSYYAVRPGITGPWQVSDRNESEFIKRAEHDKGYNQNISFSTDVKLLWQTFGAVFNGTGY
jgi:exopolysaccharide production protein ExoY